MTIALNKMSYNSPMYEVYSVDCTESIMQASNTESYSVAPEESLDD